MVKVLYGPYDSKLDKYYPYKRDLIRYQSQPKTSVKHKSTKREINLDPKIRIRQTKQCITNICKEILPNIPYVSYEQEIFYYSPEGYRRGGFSVAKKEIIKTDPNATEDIFQR